VGWLVGYQGASGGLLLTSNQEGFWCVTGGAVRIRRERRGGSGMCQVTLCGSCEHCNLV